MCDSSSCPQGPMAAAVMVTSMAVLTTSVTCRTAQGCLGTICPNITHVHTHTYTHACQERHKWQHAQKVWKWHTNTLGVNDRKRHENTLA